MSGTDLEEFYGTVEKLGDLRTTSHAQRWSDAVLRSLGLQLDRRAKKKLAASLPEELANSLTRVFWLVHFRNRHLTRLEFQNQVARRAGNSDTRFARLPILAVFGGLRRFISDDVDARVAQSLSPEVRELWRQPS